MFDPTWTAATAGAPTFAGQINQFTVGHSAVLVYSGTQRAAQSTGTGVYSASNGQYMAQSFTTAASQTTIGQAWLQVSTVGGSPVTQSIPPLTLSLYASFNGSPTGAALGSVSVDEQYVYNATFWVQFPLAVGGLAPSTIYQLVLSAVGTSTNYYVWQHSNQVSGASLSPDAATWTTQAFGMMYQVFDGGVTGNLMFLVEDSGARWTSISYDSANRVSALTEYTTAQGATPFQSARTFTYSGARLIGVN